MASEAESQRVETTATGEEVAGITCASPAETGTAIKFEVYRDGVRQMAFMPVMATPMGPESVPQSGNLAFKDGLLVLDRGDDHAGGVSLLWDVGPLGAFVLETTRVKPRAQPYNLNVELARFRLMRIVQ